MPEPVLWKHCVKMRVLGIPKTTDRFKLAYYKGLLLIGRVNWVPSSLPESLKLAIEWRLLALVQQDYLVHTA